MSKIEDMSTRELADSIREFADEVETGKFIAVAFAICSDENGGGGDACAVNFQCTPELIDEMLLSLKTKMFESLEAHDA